MTEGMMGRGSDTRIYNPRSESSYMFRNNGEEDNYSPSDPRYADAEKEKKQNYIKYKMVQNSSIDSDLRKYFSENYFESGDRSLEKYFNLSDSDIEKFTPAKKKRK